MQGPVRGGGADALFSAFVCEAKEGSPPTLPTHLHEPASGYRSQGYGASPEETITYVRSGKKNASCWRESLLKLTRPGLTSTNRVMNAVRRVLYLAANHWPYTFGVGVTGGAAFELFKIYFSFNGVNYYSVFKKKQLAKELDEFENGLMEMDTLIANSLKAKASSTQ
uniref:Uncharacterized protein n=1 Tax=Steinernema glaseri TaxID=37863 RepID=A0A1I7ZQ94_9BILA